MDVLSPNEALLSNYEVLRLVEEEQKRQAEQQKKFSNIKYAENTLTIEYETVKYLQGTPASSQTPEQIINLLEKLKKYNLTKAEKLQILNHRPRHIVELYILIEECSDRFKDEDLDGMLNIIYESLPRDDEDNENEFADQMEVEGKVDQDKAYDNDQGAEEEMADMEDAQEQEQELIHEMRQDEAVEAESDAE